MSVRVVLLVRSASHAFVLQFNNNDIAVFAAYTRREKQKIVSTTKRRRTIFKINAQNELGREPKKRMNWNEKFGRCPTHRSMVRRPPASNTNASWFVIHSTSPLTQINRINRKPTTMDWIRRKQLNITTIATPFRSSKNCICCGSTFVWSVPRCSIGSTVALWPFLGRLIIFDRMKSIVSRSQKTEGNKIVLDHTEFGKCRTIRFSCERPSPCTERALHSIVWFFFWFQTANKKKTEISNAILLQTMYEQFFFLLFLFVSF